jgi:hypothetical protein
MKTEIDGVSTTGGCPSFNGLIHLTSDDIHHLFTSHFVIGVTNCKSLPSASSLLSRQRSGWPTHEKCSPSYHLVRRQWHQPPEESRRPWPISVLTKSVILCVSPSKPNRSVLLLGYWRSDRMRCVKWRRSTDRRRTTAEEGITNATLCSIKDHTFTPV